MPLTGAPEVRAAFDPIAFFIALIIILNVLSAIFNAAKKRAAKSQAAPTQARLDAAVLQNRERLSAARAAQLARLRGALGSARAAQQSSDAAPVRTQTPTLVATTVATTAPPRAAAPLRPAAAQPSMPPAQLADPWTLPLPPTLMTLEPAATAVYQPAIGGPLMPAALVSPAAAAQPRLPVLAGPWSGANLFVAAAIVGPCAAFRPIGHTPGGW